MKKAIPFIVIGAIVIIAIVSWFVFGKKGGGEQIKQEVKKEESFTGKLKEMVARNVPMKCTFKDDKGNSGIGYVKNKKYYGEVISDGKTSYVIMIDNCMWSWSLEEKQGVKMCFDVEEGEDFWKGMDEEAKMNTPQSNYNCKPAIVSDSMFNPPEGIKFMDMDKLMNFSEDVEDKIEDSVVGGKEE